MNMMNVYRPLLAGNQAIGATSAGYTVQRAATKVVRLVSTVPCYVRIDNGAAAVVGTAMLLPANSPEYLMVDPADTIAVIDTDGTTTGILNVVEMSR